MTEELNNKPETHFNPVEKNLDGYFYGIDYKIILDYKFLDKVMGETIQLSKAKIDQRIVKKLNPGSSGVYLLTESESAFHTTPETFPTFMSFKISTCGNTAHPMLGLRHILEKLNPISGKISYYKEGLDLDKRKTVNERALEAILTKYQDQFDISRYRFEPRKKYEKEMKEGIEKFTEALDYSDFYFYDPSRLTQRMCSENRFEWPLTENTRKLGIYMEDDSEFSLKKKLG